MELRTNCTCEGRCTSRMCVSGDRFQPLGEGLKCFIAPSQPLESQIEAEIRIMTSCVAEMVN